MFVASAILSYLFAALMLALSLTAIFGPWLAFFLKCAELFGKKSFFGLLSRQTARMNVWFGALFSVVALAALFQGFFKLRAAMPPAHLLEGAAAAGVVLPPPLELMIALCGAFAAFVFFLALAHFSWQKLRARPALQAFLLFLGAAAGCAAVILAFNLTQSRPQLLNSYYYLSIFTWTGAMYPFGVPSQTSSLLMIAKFVSAALGVASAMCMCCVIIFRTRDDFGRDYYNFAQRQLARWGLACTVITLGSGLAMMLMLRGIMGGRFDLGLNDMVLSSLIYASCALFYAAIMRSPTPMRHKAGMWISLIAILVAMIGHLVFVRNFFVATGMLPGGLPMN